MQCLLVSLRSILQGGGDANQLSRKRLVISNRTEYPWVTVHFMDPFVRLQIHCIQNMLSDCMPNCRCESRKAGVKAKSKGKWRQKDIRRRDFFWPREV